MPHDPFAPLGASLPQYVVDPMPGHAQACRRARSRQGRAPPGGRRKGDQPMMAPARAAVFFVLGRGRERVLVSRTRKLAMKRDNSSTHRLDKIVSIEGART